MDRESAYNYIRSKFVKYRILRSVIKKHNFNIKQGQLSKDEKNKVHDAINSFLSKRQLTMADLENYLIQITDFPYHDLLFECTQAVELRLYHSIEKHIYFWYNPYKLNKFTQEDDLNLLELVNNKGFAWKEIMYHTKKYEQYLRVRYLTMIGEKGAYMGPRRIEALLDTGLPSTDADWNELCKVLKQNKTFILKKVKEYLNGKSLNKNKDRIVDIKLMLTILKRNHPCHMNIDIEEIINSLENCEYYENVIQINPDTEIEEANEAIDVVDEDIKELLNEDIEEVLNEDIEEDIAQKSAPFKKLPKMLEDRISNSNKYFTLFLERFLLFFQGFDNFDMNVEIDKTDIFWFNIHKELDIQTPILLSRFNQLKQEFDMKYYRDIYDSMIKLSFGTVIERLKDKLIHQTSTLMKPPSKPQKKFD